MWPSFDTQASLSWWVLSQFFCCLNGSIVRSSQFDLIMYCYGVQIQQPFEGKNTRKHESMQPRLCHVRTQGKQKENSLCCWWWGGWFGGWAATVKEVNSTDNQIEIMCLCLLGSVNWKMREKRALMLWKWLNR